MNSEMIQKHFKKGLFQVYDKETKEIEFEAFLLFPSDTDLTNTSGIISAIVQHTGLNPSTLPDRAGWTFMAHPGKWTIEGNYIDEGPTA